jgi:hypothetical protein
MLYHNLDSLVAVVLTRSSHIVDDVETLYELRQLALGGLAGREGNPARAAFWRV